MRAVTRGDKGVFQCGTSSQKNIWQKFLLSTGDFSTNRSIKRFKLKERDVNPSKLGGTDNSYLTDYARAIEP